MTKEYYIKAEKEKTRKTKNSRPILRILDEMDGYHVVGMTTAGKTFHEVYAVLDDAMRFAKQMEDL